MVCICFVCILEETKKEKIVESIFKYKLWGKVCNFGEGRNVYFDEDKNI